MAMIRRWLALTYYLYALRLAALSHFYFNPLYMVIKCHMVIKCRLIQRLRQFLRPCRRRVRAFADMLRHLVRAERF